MALRVIQLFTATLILSMSGIVYYLVFIHNSAISNTSLYEEVTLQSLNNISSEIKNNKTKISHLLQKRSNVTTSNNNYASIYKVNGRNYAPFAHRCKILNKWIKRRHGRIEGAFSDKLGYIHVWKAGGSTIEHILPHFINQSWNLKEDKYLKNRDKFYSNYSQNPMFLFSFIRDPIKRFLSSYFEVNKRLNGLSTNKLEPHLKKLQLNKDFIYNETLTPIENMRNWINKIYQLQDSMNALLTKFIDVHFYPQIYFLKWKQWKSFKLDYIGDLNMDMFDMIYNLIVYYGNYRNITKQQLQLIQHRNKNASKYNQGFEKFIIDINELNHDDIYKLCQIYWLDYICFPIVLPIPCNVTEMFEIHYNEHVVYDDNGSNSYQIKSHFV